MSKAIAIDFCQANDLILPESIDGREKKMLLLVVMLLDLCHKPDQPILCYCVPGVKWSWGSVKSITGPAAMPALF